MTLFKHTSILRLIVYATVIVGLADGLRHHAVYSHLCANLGGLFSRDWQVAWAAVIVASLPVGKCVGGIWFIADGRWSRCFLIVVLLSDAAFRLNGLVTCLTLSRHTIEAAVTPGMATGRVSLWPSCAIGVFSLIAAITLICSGLRGFTETKEESETA